MRICRPGAGRAALILATTASTLFLPSMPDAAAYESCRGLPATIIGVPGQDVVGTDGPDVSSPDAPVGCARSAATTSSA